MKCSPRPIAIAFAAAMLAAPLAARPGPLPEALIEKAMAVWQVPGLAVAAISDGRTIAVRGFGRRNVERNLPVTRRTLFATGSITKSFTVLGLAILAEDGRLEWDTPITRLVPGFRMNGTALTNAVTLRHMLSHRTGMPRHDALWYLGAFDRAGLMQRLRFLEPAAPLGEIFAYNNLMFAAAGHVAGRLAGIPWETFTRRRILNPLGMTRARLSRAAFLAATDRAAAYFPGDDGRVRIDARDTDAIGPAAAVYADVTDMARYVRFHLGDGALAGRRLIDAATARMVRTPQAAIPDLSPFPEIGQVHYAMGFYTATYRGRRLVYHPGVIDGYGGMISFMPDDGIGAIVLSNLSGRNPVPRIVTYALYDRILGLEPLPWMARYRNRDAALGAAKPPAPPLEPSGPPPRPLTAYEGGYENPAYGRMEIGAGADGGLDGALHLVRFRLVRGEADTWLVAETAWPLRKGLRITFHFDGTETAARLATPLADGPTYRLRAGDIVFTRVP